jgi:hypothetical protein
MMKSGGIEMVNRLNARQKITAGFCIALAVICVFNAPSCFAQDEGYSLMVQASPADAGIITPGIGIHRFSALQDVNVSAQPRPGYRFLYWLGDVGNTSATSTSISLDGPKILIAVFEKDEFIQRLPEGGGMTSAGGGGRSSGTSGDRLSASPGTWSTGSGISSTAYSGPNTGNHGVPIDGGKKENEILGPGDEEDEGTETPEPTSVILLGLGAAMVAGRRR